MGYGNAASAETPARLGQRRLEDRDQRGVGGVIAVSRRRDHLRPLLVGNIDLESYSGGVWERSTIDYEYPQVEVACGRRRPGMASEW